MVDADTGEVTVIERKHIPPKPPGTRRIIAIADTHTRHRDVGPLPHGDIFLHPGDLLMVGRLWSLEGQIKKINDFNEWLGTINCKHRIVIGGNHDEALERVGKTECQRLLSNATYLENETIEVDGLHILGIPLSLGDSKNRAFQDGSYAGDAARSVEQVVESGKECDIFLSHGPCDEFLPILRPKFHIWGHVHAKYGAKKLDHEERDSMPSKSYISICACMMTWRTEIQNIPFIIDIPSSLSTGGH